MGAWNNRTRILLAFTLVVVAFVLSFPLCLGLSKRAEIQPTQGEGYLLVSKVEDGMPRIRGRAMVPPEMPSLLENGVSLAVPNSSEKHIRNGGFGRHTFKVREVLFSTSDGSQPGNRRYEVVWPLWSLPEGVLLISWAVALAACFWALRNFSIQPSRWTLPFKTAVTAAFLLACLIWPSQTAASFFDGLAMPALWAGLVALWALRRGWFACMGTCLLSLVPVWAATFVYLLEARSQGSFLVAGIVPRSDAWLHFIQAIEMATTGGTDLFFNGRLIYPAFLSSLLALAGLNLSISIYLTVGLVMLASGVTARFLAWRAGWFAAFSLSLIVWVYFRNDGCGAVMTENFGLLAGLCALPFLVKGFHDSRLLVFCTGIFLLGIGFSARPGALFLLPALSLAAGFLAHRQQPSVWQSFASVALAAFLGLSGLLSNGVLTSTLLRCEGVAFGNFAYSLHGLLHGTDWEDSYFKYQGDTKRIMQINRDRLRDDPASLARGVARAYGETFSRRFLFRFGRETRLAALAMLGFCIAGVAAWFLKSWKSDAPWLTASYLGILASIPFAPPWDASVRPYAVTIPLQAFLAGSGWIMLCEVVRIVTIKTQGRTAQDNNVREAPALGIPACLSILMLLLAFAGPFLFRSELPKSTHGEVTFLPGASVAVSENPSLLASTVPAATFRRGLAELAASYPESLQQFANTPESFRFGISTPDMEVALVPLANPEKKAQE